MRHLIIHVHSVLTLINDNDKNSEAVLCCHYSSKLICGSCKALHMQLYKAHSVLDNTHIDNWKKQCVCFNYRLINVVVVVVVVVSLSIMLTVNKTL